jgi:predicted dehydrogenase
MEIIMTKEKNKTERPIRIAVIGCGAIAQIVHLPILSKMPDVQLTAIADPDDTKLRMLAEKFKVPHFFTDYQKCLAMDDLDAVHICTPNHLHASVAIDALNAGKHVLVEKPIARTVDETETMVAESKKRKKILMVGMNNRFRPDSMILKNFVEGNELGHIFYTKSGWLQRRESWNPSAWSRKKQTAGGGVFMDLGIPMLDLSIWLNGKPKAVSVFSAMYNHYRKEGIEDSSTTMVRFDNNIVLSIEVSWTLLMEHDFMYTNLFGTSGGALLNPLRIHKEMHGNLVNITPTKLERPENNHRKSYEYEIKHFVESIKHSRPVISSGEEALEIMKIAQAIYQSAKEKREIILK